jgi:Uncharacterized conserved protein
MTTKLEFKLPVFEGPLDLLLHLITKHKLDIMTVEISALLDQYLDFIAKMQEQKTEEGMLIASEFLEMAARLIYIKTLSLLPKNEEEEKLRAELSGRLTELSQIKELALALGARQTFTFIRPQAKLTGKIPYNFTHNIFDILAVLSGFETKKRREAPPEEQEFSPITQTPFVSVESKIVYVLRKLITGNRVQYKDFFQNLKGSERVAVFLAMLELIKAKRIHTDESDTYIYMTQSDDTQEINSTSFT